MQNPKPYFSGRGRMRTTSFARVIARLHLSVSFCLFLQDSHGEQQIEMGRNETATSSFVKPLAAETVKRISQMRAIGDGRVNLAGRICSAAPPSDGAYPYHLFGSPSFRPITPPPPPPTCISTCPLGKLPPTNSALISVEQE